MKYRLQNSWHASPLIPLRPVSKDLDVETHSARTASQDTNPVVHHACALVDSAGVSFEDGRIACPSLADHWSPLDRIPP